MTDVERTTYQGFNLLVTPRGVLVSTADGRPVAQCCSMSTARRVVRGYRREARS